MTRRLFFNYLPFLFLIASFFTSCNRSHEKKSGSKDNTLVVKLVATSIEVAQSYVADVQAVQFVEVKPKVEGFVEDVLVDEGEHVKKGQVLFKLSSAELYEEVKEAQANYKQVQAELKMAEVEADRVKRLVERTSFRRSAWNRHWRKPMSPVCGYSRPNRVCFVRKRIIHIRPSHLLLKGMWTVYRLRSVAWSRRPAC